MAGILKKAGFDLDDLEIDRLWKYYNLIERYNEECDLTRITRFDDFVVKHFVDSLYIDRLCELPGSLLDIGTGAGFPGIPLKIVTPHLSLVLAEQRSRRVEFLGRAVRELGLEGVEVYPHKVTDHSFFDVEGVITRALETADETLSRASHFLPAGGRVYFMKGPGAGDDLETLSDGNRRDYALELDRSYQLPGSNHRRRLLVFRKTAAARRRTYRIFIDQKENREVVITSDANATFREFKRVVKSDGVKKTGTTLVSGKRIIRDVVNSGAAQARSLIIHDGYAEDDDVINAHMSKLAAEKKLFILKKALYNELDIFSTGGPLMITGAPEIPDWDGSLAPGCNLLIPFQDPANAGSVIRTAAAFGVERIVMLREAANPWHPRSVRASSGAVFGAPLFRGPSISEIGGMSGGGKNPIIALDKNGEPLDSFVFPERFLLLPGMEGPGVPASSFTTVAIPMEGRVESLNAAIAASIALYAWRSRR